MIINILSDLLDKKDSTIFIDKDPNGSIRIKYIFNDAGYRKKTMGTTVPTDWTDEDIEDALDFFLGVTEEKHA